MLHVSGRPAEGASTAHGLAAKRLRDVRVLDRPPVTEERVKERRAVAVEHDVHEPR
jgi:hypothetical protein